MNLGVIDKDEYRQYRYWQMFQKLLLAGAAGFTVAGMFLVGDDLRLLARVVAGVLWVLFAASAATAFMVALHMVRDLPASLQSLLLFSSESADDVRQVAGDHEERLVGTEKASES